MSFLQKVSSRFRLDAKQSASSAEEIATLQLFSPIQVPVDYLTLIREASELEFLVDGSEYIRIWGASGCIEMNNEYEINANIPDSLAIGDNEGGAALIILPKAEHPGLYLISFGCLDVLEGRYVAPSLTDLLINEVGIGVVS